MIDGKFAVTGEGDAYRIMATVVDTMEDFYRREKKNILSFEFTADREDSRKESRIKLYRVISNKFARKYNFSVHEVDNVWSVTFNLRPNRSNDA